MVSMEAMKGATVAHGSIATRRRNRRRDRNTASRGPMRIVGSEQCGGSTSSTHAVSPPSLAAGIALASSSALNEASNDDDDAYGDAYDDAYDDASTPTNKSAPRPRGHGSTMCYHSGDPPRPMSSSTNNKVLHDERTSEGKRECGYNSSAPTTAAGLGRNTQSGSESTSDRACQCRGGSGGGGGGGTTMNREPPPGISSGMTTIPDITRRLTTSTVDSSVDFRTHVVVRGLTGQQWNVPRSVGSVGILRSWVAKELHTFMPFTILTDATTGAELMCNLQDLTLDLISVTAIKQEPDKFEQDHYVHSMIEHAMYGDSAGVKRVIASLKSDGFSRNDVMAEAMFEIVNCPNTEPDLILETVRTMLDNGASPNSVDPAGIDAFNFVLGGQEIEMQPFSRIQGVPLLMYAAWRGHEELCQELLDYGADPDIRDSFGGSPLHVAVEQNKLPVVAVLVAAGASVNARNAQGHTPIHLIRDFTAPNAYNFLKSHGAVE